MEIILERKMSFGLRALRALASWGSPTFRCSFVCLFVLLSFYSIAIFLFSFSRFMYLSWTIMVSIFTDFDEIFAGFYWVLRRFQWVRILCYGFSLVLLNEKWFGKLNWVLLALAGFYFCFICVLPGFTGFYWVL